MNRPPLSLDPKLTSNQQLAEINRQLNRRRAMERAEREKAKESSQTTTPQTTTVQSTTPQTTTPQTTTVQSTTPRPSLLGTGSSYTASRITVVQDGLNKNELLVLKTLWSTSGAVPGVEQYRVISASFRGVAEACHITRKGAEIVMGSLEKKLCIEIDTRTVGFANGYRVYSFAKILQRWNVAGMCRVKRWGRTVTFVDENGQPLQSTTPQTTTLETTTGQTTCRQSTVVVRATLSSKSKFEEHKQNDDVVVPLAPDEIRSALAPFCNPVDDGLVNSLIADCRAIAPDVTTAEVLYFIGVKGQQGIRQQVRNLNGFLLRAVPLCLAGDSFAAFRADRARQTEDSSRTVTAGLPEAARRAAEIDEFRTQQQRIANDPNAAEIDRRFARGYLGLGSEGVK